MSYTAVRPSPRVSLVTSAVLFAAAVLLPSAARARVVTVDTTVDDASLSACDDTTPNDCSLRGAVAGAATASEHSDIRLPSGTYTLTQPGLCPFVSAFGDQESFTATTLCLNRDVAIIGSGADTTFIDGNMTGRTIALDAQTIGAISGVTITRGSQSGGTFIGGGGGILNHGVLTLTDVVVTGNSADTGGGGIKNAGTLTALRATITGNSANGFGGAIDNQHVGLTTYSTGFLTVIDSTVSQNTAGGAGGIVNQASDVTISGTTLSSNLGGAVVNFGPNPPGRSTINIVDSTITGNDAHTGAAILNGPSSPAQSSVVNLRNVTVAGNSADGGGGISNFSDQIVTLQNTILAGNASRTDTGPDCLASVAAEALVSRGYNIIGNTQDCLVTGDTTGNRTDVDVQVGVLTDNGGSTQTLALLDGSPAIDAGNPAAPGSSDVACAAADQRGVLRPLGARCDIGAFERATTLTVTKIAPARGGAGSSVVTLVSGAAFAPGAAVALRRSGAADILGAPVTVEAGGASLATRFDLTGAALGTWDVVVRNPDAASATLASAFIVEEPRAPDLWAILVGRRAVTTGMPARFTVLFGNRGNGDAFGVPLTLVVPATFTATFAFAIAGPPEQPGQVFNDYSDVPVVVTTPDATQFISIPFLLPVIPAGFTGALDFLVTPPADVEHGARFLLSALIGTPFFSGESVRADVVTDAVAGAKQYAHDHLHTTIPAMLDGMLADYAANQLTLAVQTGRDAVVADLDQTRQVYSLAHMAIDLAEFAAAQTVASAPPQPTWLASLTRRLMLLVGIGTPAVEAETKCPPCLCGGQVVTPGCSCSASSCIQPVDPNKLPKKPKGFSVADCMDIERHTVSKDGTLCKPDGSFPCGAQDLFSGAPQCRFYPISMDPNDKTGSPGAGAARFVSAGTPMPYSIAFENEPRATAPAQTVTITDHLDTQTLDLDTFSFGQVSIADVGLIPPPGQTQFTGALDLRPARNIVVKIDGALDKSSGVVTWHFASLDPATLNPITDPDDGFLPPDTAPPAGDGAVQFLVHPKRGLATGTQIGNQASIVFDVNAPLDTPEWLNTADADPPASHVDAVDTADCNATDLTVRWSGTDAGSGIQSYTILVSENGGPVSRFLVDTTDTSAPLTGQLGKTYAFYSVARDFAGNVEAAPATPDVVHRVGCATCVGDCNGDGQIAIDELVKLVNIALGSAPASACASGVPNGTEVNISLLIRAVNNALSGCDG